MSHLGLARPARLARRFAFSLAALLVLTASSAPDAGARPPARSPWVRPVPGPVTRTFGYGRDPFAAGQHRGVDLGAPPGATVRAPCGGRVIAAGRIGVAGRVVTVACGPWHASVLPLAGIDVQRGESVHAGARVGTAGESRRHPGVHLGIRRAADRFGYVDPMRLLGDDPPPLPAAPPPRADGRSRTPATSPAPAGLPAARTAPVASGRPLAVPSGRRVLAPTGHRAPAQPARTGQTVAPPARKVPPWPAWAGAAVLLAGASGGLVGERRRHQARKGRIVPHRPHADGVRSP